MDTIRSLNKDFTFDNDDVKILISGPGGEKQFGVVCSQAMCLASPVWKKFIFPPFRRLREHDPAQVQKTVEDTEIGSSTLSKKVENVGEGEPTMPIEQLDFIEDNPAALCILLRIAHLDFASVSKKLDTDALLEIAVLCDEYDCVRLVSMFLPYWLVDEKTQSEESGSERWIFIARVFGRPEIFRSLTEKMVDTAGVSKEGEIVDCPMPPDITGNKCQLSKDKATDS